MDSETRADDRDERNDLKQLTAGSRLGPYQIEILLGAGGMGQVYRAFDTRLHRTVAIKLLAPEKFRDPEQKRRFLQEARAASALNHANIVTLHDIANDGSVEFLVMEYVPGRPMNKILSPKGLPSRKRSTVQRKSPMH
jgi:serine/threonine protein kinase